MIPALWAQFIQKIDLEAGYYFDPFKAKLDEVFDYLKAKHAVLLTKFRYEEK